MTIVIDMSVIWPKYGWDVTGQQVARKLGIGYDQFVDQINTNKCIFLNATNIPDLLPGYAWTLSDHIDDDDIILQL